MAVSAMTLATAASAQDIYKVEQVTNKDLNGTARFVGMGGAMGALGADISTMGTNPAGIGLFRSSDINMTGSVNIQPDAEDFYDINKARASFDNIGFVVAARNGDSGVNFVNFGFNYQKSRNLKNFIGVQNFRTGGLSQSLQMLDLSYVNGWLDYRYEEDWDLTTPLTKLGYDTQMLEPIYDNNGKIDGYNPVEAESYDYKRVQWGSTQQYDFNISMNWEDQVYAGLTLGVYNVNHHAATDYTEWLPDANGGLHDYYMINEERLSGIGWDIKMGLIVRPIEESPFRIGLAVHTPTFYNLTQDAFLYMNSPFALYNDKGDQISNYTEASAEIWDNNFNIRTPWKFNLSLGTTVGNFLALGAEYEFADYGSACISYDNYLDEWNNYWDQGVKDKPLNREIDRFLKPVSTVRLGAEARLAKGVFARVGYNFVSAPFEKDAYLNLFTDSPSYFYSTNTDYVNWGDTHRATAGLGLRGKHFYADMTYQYQTQKGELYTFHVPEQAGEQNRLQAADIQQNRHNVMLTLGYKF